MTRLRLFFWLLLVLAAPLAVAPPASGILPAPLATPSWTTARAAMASLPVDATTLTVGHPARRPPGQRRIDAPALPVLVRSFAGCVERVGRVAPACRPVPVGLPPLGPYRTTLPPPHRA